MVAPDTVYLNGQIYCVVPRYRYVEAVAVKEGKFVAVGSNDEIKSLITQTTAVVDLKGKTVLPGLHDMHIHAYLGAYSTINECNLPPESHMSVPDILACVREYAKNDPSKPWIVGGTWQPEIMPYINKSQLDAIDSSRPIILYDFSHHNAWVNSKALEIAGIDAHTSDPEGGHILRDESGEPTGVLIELPVLNLVAKHIPKGSEQEHFEAVKWIVNQLNSHGITGIKEPMTDREILKTYKRLDDENGLHLRIVTNLMYKVPLEISMEEQLALIEDRKKYASSRIFTDFAKMFIDGVPAFKTAAFLQPYLGDQDASDNLLVDAEQLKKDLAHLDSMGITVKMHAVGDAAIRVGLNAIEAARAANGFSGLKHEIAHTSFIHPEDIHRFRALDAVAEFSPMMWFPSDFHIQDKEVIGDERADGKYSIRSVVDSGALAVYGTDWPVVPSFNPWPSLEAMVTRQNPYIDFPGTVNASEALDVVQAIELFTINGARSMYLDNVTGSIQVGKSADMIVLDRNPLSIPPTDIRNTKVLCTVLEGKTVYERSVVYEETESDTMV